MKDNNKTETPKKFSDTLIYLLVKYAILEAEKEAEASKAGQAKAC